MRVRPLTSVSIAKDFFRVYQQTLSEVMLSTEATASRVLYLRPSQMPFCPVEFFVTHAMGGLSRAMDMTGAFYTSVGTAVHEVMQDYLCKSGRFLADYYCRECVTWHRLSYKHECCGFHTKYHEVKIDYKGITGHIDAIYRDTQGLLWIADFKTTSIVAAPKKAKDPGIAYIEQIETYAVLFELQYKLPIEGIMDIFILRDNPTGNPTIFSRTLTDARRTQIKNRLKRYLTMHRAALGASTLGEASELLEYPRCKNPYCRTCKLDDDARRLVLKRAYKRGKSLGFVPIRGMAEAEMSRERDK